MNTPTTLIKYQNTHYHLRDAKGDGNCLYHFFVNSGILNTNDHMGLRRFTIGKVWELYKGGGEESMRIESIFASYEISGNVLQWCNKQLHDGEWDGTLDITFISMIRQVNIQSFSNIVSDLRLYDSYGFLKNYDMPLNFNDPNIYVFCHTYGQPYQVTLAPNHWITMVSVSLEKFPNCNIFDLDIPSTVNTSKSLIDLTKYGKGNKSKKQATLNNKGTLGIVSQQSHTVNGEKN